jgi:hypothetical protein
MTIYSRVTALYKIYNLNSTKGAAGLLQKLCFISGVDQYIHNISTYNLVNSGLLVCG